MNVIDMVKLLMIGQIFFLDFFLKRFDWAATSEKNEWAGTLFCKKKITYRDFFHLEKLNLPLSFPNKYCSLS